MAQQADVTKQIFEASGRSFQTTRNLTAKYGIQAAITAMNEIMAKDGVKRMRVYGREAGGIGPIV